MLAPSESVWRAAGTIILGTKSGTQTMHAPAPTAFLGEVMTGPPAARRSQSRSSFFYSFSLKYIKNHVHFVISIAFSVSIDVRCTHAGRKPLFIALRTDRILDQAQQ